jgi:rRNA maturation endonuclease Nob1
MTVCNVGIRGFFAEDLPSILLNSAVLLLEMKEGSKADESTLASFVGLLFSCLMTGRKSGLRQERRELRQKKLDLEQVECMHGNMVEMRSSHLRLKQVNEDLEEEMKLKKHSEEELKVMVQALEAVSKERQNELKEVMMESTELKVEKLLGKGG